MQTVYAKSTGTYRFRGELVRVRTGDAWDPDDPFVQQHPTLFSGGDEYVHRTDTPAERVETAAKRPGGKRAKAVK